MKNYTIARAGIVIAGLLAPPLAGVAVATPAGAAPIKAPALIIGNYHAQRAVPATTAIFVFSEQMLVSVGGGIATVSEAVLNPANLDAPKAIGEAEMLTARATS